MEPLFENEKKCTEFVRSLDESVRRSALNEMYEVYNQVTAKRGSCKELKDKEYTNCMEEKWGTIYERLQEMYKQNIENREDTK